MDNTISSLGSNESIVQTAFRSVHPFLLGSCFLTTLRNDVCSNSPHSTVGSAGEWRRGLKRYFLVYIAHLHLIEYKMLKLSTVYDTIQYEMLF